MTEPNDHPTNEDYVATIVYGTARQQGAQMAAIVRLFRVAMIHAMFTGVIALEIGLLLLLRLVDGRQ